MHINYVAALLQRGRATYPGVLLLRKLSLRRSFVSPRNLIRHAPRNLIRHAHASLLGQCVTGVLMSKIRGKKDLVIFLFLHILDIC